MSGVRTLVDATAVPPDRGGVGRYVDELLPALLAEGAELVVACQVRDLHHYRQLLPGVEVVAAPAGIARRPARLLWEQVGLPRLARRLGVGLLHCPHYTMPVLARVPVVVTLHDATFFTHPEVHSRTKRSFFRAWTRFSLRRARRAVVPSQATKEELVRLGVGAADRIDVAHLGVDLVRFHVPGDDERAAVRELLGLGEQPYIAFLGTIEPRKNVPALVRAWVAACRTRPGAPALVLAGGRGWDEEVDDALAEVPVGLQCLRPGYLPLESLCGLLGGAELVAYPSLGEGFGLPVLEAMACGAPVLTSRELSLPEVGGDAVAYTGTSSPEIGTALAGLLDDPARRAELADRAVRRAATFTWRACAQRHLAAYHAALESTPGPR